MNREIHDLLDRQEFVARMLTIARRLSSAKKSACYAVNGDWGVGKTFVINMFIEQAMNDRAEGDMPRYLIFRYNCWEYDYYEEPIIAIVAALLEQMNEYGSFLDPKTKETAVAILKAIGKGLSKKALQLIDEKTGINFDEIAGIARDGGEEAVKKIAESHEYDQYFDFKENMKVLQKTIASLAIHQSLIFIVDELDRCLPEYTIKVLERLHHLFDNVPNVQVILATDIRQIEHVVKNIYGTETDTEKYLDKFVDFQLALDAGTLNDEYTHYFSEYIDCFGTVNGLVNKDELDLFIKMIMEGFDIRKRISILQKGHLIHDTFFNDAKLDYAYLCMEVLLLILDMCKLDLDTAQRLFSINSLFSIDRISTTKEELVIPKGLSLIAEIYRRNKSERNNQSSIFSMMSGETFVSIECFWGIILSAYRGFLGFEEDRWIDHGQNRITSEMMNALIAHTKEYWQYLKAIK